MPKKKSEEKKLPTKMSKFQRLLSDFQAAAEAWGWEQDQGTGEAVGEAEMAATKARRALERYVASLEAKIDNDDANDVATKAASYRTKYGHVRSLLRKLHEDHVTMLDNLYVEEAVETGDSVPSESPTLYPLRTKVLRAIEK